ncbi:MAG: hypothetical protein GW949_09165 [Spirochaetales bacterium]|nr:hypothetical protein [Spirochaetales bacterium]
MKNTFLVLLFVSFLVAAFLLLIIHGFFVPSVVIAQWTLNWIGMGVLRRILETGGPIVLWVAILRFSLLPVLFGDSKPLKRGETGERESIRNFKKVLWTGTLSIFVLGLAFLVFHPMAVRAQDQIIFRSQFARDQLSRALVFEEEGQLFFALRAAEAALYGAQNFPEAQVARERIQRKVAQAPTPPLEPQPLYERSLPLNLSFAELVARARNFLAEEDFFSAVFYADQALLLSGFETRQDALAIRQEARRRILAIDLSGGDARAQEVFFAKRDSLRAYEEGRFIESYYIMKALEDIDPLDGDVLEWFPRIQQALREANFFLDEAVEALSKGSQGPPVAWQEVGADGSRIWVYSAAMYAEYQVRFPPGSMLEVQLAREEETNSGARGRLQNHFLYDLEIAVIDRESGALVAQGFVPFGKAVLNSMEEGEPVWHLQTIGITQARPEDRNELRWVGDVEQIRSDKDELFWVHGLLRLPLDPPNLLSAGTLSSSAQGLNLAQLFGAVTQAGRLGYETLALETEFLHRGQRIFLDLLMFVVALGWGWSHRVRVPGVYLIFGFASLPLVMVMTVGLHFFVLWIFRIGGAALLLALGFIPGLALWVVLSLILLVVSATIVNVRYGHSH